jgi:hypothetical protein
VLQQLSDWQPVDRTVIAVVCLSGWLGMVVSAVAIWWFTRQHT